MNSRIVFLDAETIGPGVELHRPSFKHEWQSFEKTAPEQLLERLEGATVAITNKVALREESLQNLPDLKLIAIAATGFDCVDVDACRKQGIAVTNIRGYAVNTVPEHTFALILALRRNLIEYRQQVLDGQWIRSNQFCFFNRPIRDLAGSVLGIVGAGMLGQAVGRVGHAFGMQVKYHDAYAKAAPDHGTLISLEELRDTADVLTCHCPLTDETRNLIDAPFLEAMKSDAIVINTARGGIIDEQALDAAIRSGGIAGAGIDVTSTEPPAADTAIMKLAELPNVLLTPHVAWASVGGMQTLCDQLTSNIDAFMAGESQNRLV